MGLSFEKFLTGVFVNGSGPRKRFVRMGVCPTK
jgi:hypothetical protein